jgi:MFS superfamily sulfate permease-like transporter
MPAQLLGEGGLQFPDFSKIGSIAFWTAVVSIALVSGVESLLSAKAVDAIDPMQRESDLDQDMVSMGSGSTVAALIGGLPMISEIVRSSANIANGGKTQWANFFHGSFLLFFVLFASTVIELIPLSALAAMLVFTGFRLASPAEFKHMFEVGRQELYIFLVTLIGVVATDLIIGVLLGLVFKFLMMIFKGLPVKDLFRLKLRHEEHDGELEIHIDSKGLIFSNFLSLKSALDKAIKAHKNVKLDVSALLLIDHTCMQHLKLYDQKAKREGVGIQLSGLELFNSDSIHPLAQRYRDKYLTQKS